MRRVKFNYGNSSCLEACENSPTEPAIAMQISFVTDDVAAAYAKALSFGAVPVNEPQTMPWEQIVSCVRDLNGVMVGIVNPNPLTANKSE
jgi:uncharacterized glyoxalase superfamily protein PhnB